VHVALGFMKLQHELRYDGQTDDKGVIIPQC